LSPFFFLVWTDRDSTSLSNWSTCMFNVSIVFWRRKRKEEEGRQRKVKGGRGRRKRIEEEDR